MMDYMHPKNCVVRETLDILKIPTTLNRNLVGFLVIDFATLQDVCKTVKIV